MVFVPYYILILLFTIIIDYIAGIQIEQATNQRKRRTFLIASIVANIGCLVFFKYYNFANENLTFLLDKLGVHNPIPILHIILPIGLSFHTFQALSYTIEVYKGNFKAERHLGIYALYVMFYPQLVAGPIERPQNVLHQFYEKFDFDEYRVYSGLRIMMWGMFKKVFIADRLALLVDTVFNNPEGQNGLTYFIATLFFTIQIYCDFSGYSDIALGAAKVMGFKLMQNFNTPYLATSISNFWSRWHISLSTWFRDYVYIPLGGNRVSKTRRYYNTFIVFMLSGLWHGANWTFVAWGGLHGFYLLIENMLLSSISSKAFSLRITFLKPIFVFFIVMLAWIYFRATTITEANKIIATIASDFVPQIIIFFSGRFNFYGLRGIDISSISISFLIIIFLIVVEKKYGAFVLDQFALNTKRKSIRWGIYYLLLVLILFSNNIAQTFIYFQF
jgi:D-alanyl-lipoteichoic acid acyltransferase DltB (MBOAT superfamily)